MLLRSCTMIMFVVMANKRSCCGCLCYLLVAAAASLSLDAPPVPAGHALHQALRHFEVLHRHHLEHSNVLPGESTLEFSTLGRKFRLRLSSRKGLFSDALGVTSVGADGEIRRKQVKTQHFLTGEIQGEIGSRVTAHFDPEKGVLAASIVAEGEHYFIEPSHRHIKQSHDFHMISYRASDLKYNITSKSSGSYCGTQSRLMQAPPPSYRPLSRHHTPNRLRRRQATPLTKNSCPMLLVATGRFHRAYSDTLNVENTIFFMVQVIDDIDQNIFRSIRWDDDILNFGLSIKNITVFEAPSSNPAYNEDKVWESGEMLRLFSHYDWNQFCLAHLFAYQDFTDGLVGVAYPASPDDFPGGICTTAEPNFNGGRIATANVALSSYMGHGKRPLLQAEGRLITSHEIGHNWGSEHDPTAPIGPCNPVLSNSEGKFLMFPSLADGLQPNNERFSECSRAFVSEVLRAKSSDCFVSSDGVVSACGNYEMEEGEECDAGLQGILGNDACCDERCRLREGKNCSDINHICCSDCSFSPATKVCRAFPAINSRCHANTSCTGTSKTCPAEVQRLPYNAPCRGKGRCLFNGTTCSGPNDCDEPAASPLNVVQCYDFCQLRGMEQCFCSQDDNQDGVPDDECYFCCRSIDHTSSSSSSSSGGNTSAPLCRVVLPRETLPEGSSCMGGLCMAGECQPITQDLVNRLYRLFADISIDALFQFLSENIVGAVLFFTTVIWVVMGTIIHCYDLRKFRDFRDKIANLEDDIQGQDEEDHLDHAYLDSITLTTPSVDAHKARRGLSRMGSRSEFTTPLFASSLGGRFEGGGGGGRGGFGRQYSIKAGCTHDRLVHGRKLSAVLEQSKGLDPAASNIMQHILNSQSENTARETIV